MEQPAPCMTVPAIPLDGGGWRGHGNAHTASIGSGFCLLGMNPVMQTQRGCEGAGSGERDLCGSGESTVQPKATAVILQKNAGVVQSCGGAGRRPAGLSSWDALPCLNITRRWVSASQWTQLSPILSCCCLWGWLLLHRGSKKLQHLSLARTVQYLQGSPSCLLAPRRLNVNG